MDVRDFSAFQNTIAFVGLKRYSVLINFMIVLFLTSAISQEFTVNGRVIDATTGKPVTDVNVYVKETKQGGITDRDGFFKIVLKPGVYGIEFQHLNYEKENVIVRGWEGEEIKIEVKLKPRVITLEPVQVQAEFFESEHKSFLKYRVDAKMVEAMPSIFEGDIFKTLSILPGVITISDFSNQLFIWGGNFDHTLISIDGIPVYNPYHLGGIFGMINPMVVGSINLYPVAHPSTYGDYLSGVVDVRTKVHGSQNIEGSAELAISSFKVYLGMNLPQVSNVKTGSFIISFRRVYYDIIGKMLFDLKYVPYYFYDIFAKYTVALGKISMLSVGGFVSRDIYDVFGGSRIVKYYPYKPSWGNDGLSLSFATLSGDFLIEFGGYISSSFASADAVSDYYFISVGNKLLDYTARASVGYKISAASFKAEIGLQRVRYNYRWRTENYNLWYLFWGGFFDESDVYAKSAEVFFDHAPDPFDYSDKIEKRYFDLRGEIKFGSISFDAGARFALFERKIFLSPNFNFKWKVRNDISFGFGYGKYYQHSQTIKDKVVAVLNNPYSVYIPFKQLYPSAEHLMLNFTTGDISKVFIESALYLKRFKNLISSSYDTAEYKYGEGLSYGLNLSLKGQRSLLWWTISYSLGYAKKESNGEWYPANYDQRHLIKIYLGVRLSKRWNFEAFWIYGSGLPYTPVYIYYDFNKKIVKYGERNSVYLPDYHRLDIKVEGNYSFGRFTVRPWIQVYNLYNNKRVFRYEFQIFSSVDKKYSSFIIPSFGIKVEAKF